jgi:hypothetical protein
MSEVKAEFRIGKTQWAQWGNEARTAYNTSRRLGFTHETGVAEANAVQAKLGEKKRSFLDKLGDAIEDVADVAGDVAEVAAVVSPTIAVAKTVARATRKKKAK